MHVKISHLCHKDYLLAFFRHVPKPLRSGKQWRNRVGADGNFPAIWVPLTPNMSTSYSQHTQGECSSTTKLNTIGWGLVPVDLLNHRWGGRGTGRQSSMVNTQC